MPSLGATVVLDARWSQQQSGIGRFSREVLRRLPWSQSLRVGRPSSALDPFLAERLILSAQTLLYCPGYNGGVTRARQLLTLHDLMHLGTEGSPLKRIYYDRLLRPIIQRCGRVLTVSRASAEQIGVWLDDTRVSIDIVGNGVSFSIPSLEQLRSVAIGRRTGRGPLRLLYVGNMKSHKRFPVALHALRRLSGARLTVVSGDERALADLLAEVDLATRSRVAVVSNVTDESLSSLYRASDVLIMPSTEEGFGLPALEALIHALPVVFWEGCIGLDETLGGFGTRVSDPSDARAWAEAVERAGGSGLNVSTLLVDHLAKYSWDDVARRVERSIVEACHGRG